MPCMAHYKELQQSTQKVMVAEGRILTVKRMAGVYMEGKKARPW